MTATFSTVMRSAPERKLNSKKINMHVLNLLLYKPFHYKTYVWSDRHAHT